MNTWFTASELAGLPGLRITDRRIRERAKRERWDARKRQGTKAMEYRITSLPDATKSALIQRHAAALAEQPKSIEPAEHRPLAAWQREIRDARLVVLNLVDDLTPAFGQTQALRQVADMARAGTLPSAIADALHTANARSGRARTVSPSTLGRWLAERRQGAETLAPQTAPRHAPPAWMPQLLALYQQPNKPTVARCLRAWPDGSAAPNLRTAQRHIAALPVELREFGRLGKNARRAVQPFVRRTTDGLWPMDVVTVDGHLFKAYVRHPMTGRKFRPEVTTYLDVATRKAIGFSAWLAESQYAIWSAFREFLLNPEIGIPAIHYSDNGAYRGEQHRALCSRIGTTVMFSEAYRAQARGLIERFNSSVWVPLAKDLPVYVGDDADPEATKKALQIADKTGENLPGWEDFIAGCRQGLNAYNDRRHASIKKSPNQAWADAVAEGWAPTTLTDDDLHDILPSRRRKVARGEVNLPWGRYFADELSLWHGREVQAHFQPQDGSRIWVADERGTLICTAERNANARPYVPESQLAHAKAQREEGRARRLERKLELVREEGAAQIEHQPAEVDPIIQAQTRALFEQQEQTERVRLIEDDPRRLHAYWLRVSERLEAGAEVSFEDRRGWQIYRQSQAYESQRQLFEDFGLEAADFDTA
jgi:putative transposase